MHPVRFYIITLFILGIFGFSRLIADTRGSTANVDENNTSYNGDPNVQVIYPNGGETLMANSVVEISWTSVNLKDNVKIELSVDGGKTWDAVVANAENTGNYTWDVPDRPTTDARIRISGSPTITAYDISDASFIILGSSLLFHRIEEVEATLAGGYVVEERLEASNGKVARLTTTGTGTMTYAFALPPDDYTLFVRYLDENDGFCTSVININGNKVKEWIWDESVESDIYVYRSIGTFHFNSGDQVEMWTMRDGGEYGRIDYFEFVRTDEQVTRIKVIAPNGGENWPVDSSQDIIWSAENTAGSYDVQLSRDGGTTWENLATNIKINPAADSTISLTIGKLTGPVSDRCLVRISDADRDVFDDSDALFSISESQAPKLTLLSPNGGETWLTGTLQTITWFSRNISGPIKIELTRNAGAGWETLIESAPNDGAFDWSVTIPPSDDCLIRLTDPSTAIADTSDGRFVIKGTPKLTLTLPNGDERWDVGTKQRIRWASEFVIGNIKLNLSRDAGNSWESITADTINNGTYYWTVTGPETQSALVALSTVDGSTADTSDAVFSIVTLPSITITSPNGGETWQIGESHTITWASVNTSGFVHLELSRNDGADWQTLTNNTEDTGEIDWLVTAPASPACRIRISDVNGTAFDVSDIAFSIAHPLEPMLTLLQPNGGETWIIGTMQKLTWFSQDIATAITIDLSRDNGTTWETLSEVAADSAGFTWKVTAPATDSARIRLSAHDGSIQSQNKAVFTILEQPIMTINTPNGGETWTIGTLQTIEWTSVNSSGAVKIQLSRDNGIHWQTLVESTDDDGSYAWNVTGPASNACLVMISDVDGSPIDISNAAFSVLDEPTISLITPNGGEIWHIGEVTRVVWQSAYGGATIKIELSRDAGLSWQALATDAPNNGSWPWTVTAPASKSCFIRITDVQTNISDTSNAPFQIDYPTAVARTSKEIPAEFALQQNYPNPFNPETRIHYHLPTSATVRLEIYNSLGNRIATLVNEIQLAGQYMLTWKGQDDHGHHMPSGIYFCRISADGFSDIKRMMLMR